MNAYCDRFPELEVLDAKVKFVNSKAINITEPQAKALEKISAEYGIVFEAVGEFESAPVINDGMEDEPVNLDNMTVPQLLDFARANDIDIGGATKKANILQAIVDAAENTDDC